MKKIDNSEEIKKILKFLPEKEIYYQIQIIKRKKDKGNENLDRSEIKLLDVYIRSIEEFDNKMELVRVICDNMNARAYISLIPRSGKKLLKVILGWLSNNIDNKSVDFTRILSRNSLDKRTQKTKGLFDKPMWVVDIDNEEFLKPLKSLFMDKTKINCILPTPNGYHMIINSFNPKELNLDKNGDYNDSGMVFSLRTECNTILYY